MYLAKIVVHNSHDNVWHKMLCEYMKNTETYTVSIRYFALLFFWTSKGIKVVLELEVVFFWRLFKNMTLSPFHLFHAKTINRKQQHLFAISWKLNLFADRNVWVSVTSSIEGILDNLERLLEIFCHWFYGKLIRRYHHYSHVGVYNKLNQYAETMTIYNLRQRIKKTSNSQKGPFKNNITQIEFLFWLNRKKESVPEKNCNSKNLNFVSDFVNFYVTDYGLCCFLLYKIHVCLKIMKWRQSNGVEKF